MLRAAPNAHIRPWLGVAVGPTVLLVEDHLSEYKGRLAPSLAAARAAMKEAALDKGEWNQSAVALRIGTSEATYRRWENPKDPHVPDVFQLVLLAEQFEVPVCDLVDPEPLTARELAITKRVLRGRQKGMERVRQAGGQPTPSPQRRPPQAPGGSPR